MKLQPVGTNILCAVHEGRETSLHLPDGIELQPYAVVIAVGDSAKLYPVGDKVLFNPSVAIFADTIDGKKCCIINETSVFARYIDSEAPANVVEMPA